MSNIYNIFTSPIKFALERTMKESENTTDENDKFIYESLRRANCLFEDVTIHGISICGMTYEDYARQCKDKKNLLFLSDEEFEKYKRIIKEFDKYSKIVNFIDKLSEENRI